MQNSTQHLTRSAIPNGHSISFFYSWQHIFSNVFNQISFTNIYVIFSHLLNFRFSNIQWPRCSRWRPRPSRAPRPQPQPRPSLPQALLRAQTSLRRPVPHEARQDRAQQYGVAPRPRALARGRGDPRGRPGLQPPAGVRGPDVAADPGERRVPRRHPALAHVRPSAGHVRRRPLARRQPRPQLSRRPWLPRPEATTLLLM